MKLLKRILLIFLILVAGSGWGIRAVMLSDLTVDSARLVGDGDKSREQHDVRVTEHLTQKPPAGSGSGSVAVKNDRLLGESNRPYKDFDVNEMIESFLKPFQCLLEPNKKPKMKTVVSLTEVVGPKRSGLQSSRTEQMSQFGVKEVGLLDDPFCFDLGKILAGFVPKFSKVDLIWPTKHGREKHGDAAANLTDRWEFTPLVQSHHHLLKKELMGLPLPGPDDKGHNVPSLFIKQSSGDTPLVSLGQIKLDEGVAVSGEETKDKMCNLVKALPYIEGAIGGVMLVMVMLVIASWRVRKPNGIWARVPFVDKSQYIEKV